MHLEYYIHKLMLHLITHFGTEENNLRKILQE